MDEEFLLPIDEDAERQRREEELRRLEQPIQTEATPEPVAPPVAPPPPTPVDTPMWGSESGRAAVVTGYSPGFEPGGRYSPYAPPAAINDALGQAGYDRTDPNVANQVQQIERAQDSIRDRDDLNDMQKANASRQFAKKLNRVDPDGRHRRGSPAMQRSKVEEYFAQNVKKVDGGYLAIDARGTPHYFKVENQEEERLAKQEEREQKRQDRAEELAAKREERRIDREERLEKIALDRQERQMKLDLELEGKKLKAMEVNADQETKRFDTTLKTRKAEHGKAIKEHPYTKLKPEQKFKPKKKGWFGGEDELSTDETDEALALKAKYEALQAKTEDDLIKETRDFLAKQRGEKPEEKDAAPDKKAEAAKVRDAIRAKAKQAGIPSLTPEDRAALAEAIKVLEGR